MIARFRQLRGLRRHQLRLRPRSLRGKLTLNAILMVSLGVVIAVLTSLLGVRHFLLSSIDNELMAGREGVERAGLEVEQAIALVTVADLGGDLPREATKTVTGHYSVVALLDESGEPQRIGGRAASETQRELAAALSDPRQLLDDNEPHGVHAGGTYYRATAIPLDDGGIVLIATSTEVVWKTIQKIVKFELLAGSALIVLLGFATYRGSTRRLRPLEDMVETASAIAEASPDAGSLSRRVATSRATPATEVEQLRTALNGMLHQVETAFVAREHAADQLRRFVADASHELRTPLSAIRGYLQLYERAMLGDEQAEERALARMTAETERMARLVDELVALTRLDQRPTLRPTAVDLCAVTGEALADLRAQQPDRPVHTSLAGECRVRVDEGVLRQIVGNLLTNVRTHTPTSAPVTIEVGMAVPGDETGGGSAAAPGAEPGSRRRGVLRVADEGPGLASQDAERIFDRFFRTGGSAGSGLGMSIVRAGVESQGGTVQVSTAPGAGLTVTVELPLADEPRPTDAATGVDAYVQVDR